MPSVPSPPHALPFTPLRELALVQCLFTKLDLDCGAVDQPTTLELILMRIFKKFIQPKLQNTGLPTLASA